MADRTTLAIAKMLAPLVGAALANPRTVFERAGRAIGNAADRRLRALDLIQKDEGPALRLGNEAWLLHANHSPVPFEFRDTETADFRDWFYDIDDGAFLKCRLLTGNPGRGKTRFVREFVRALRSEGGRPFTGGFLDTAAITARPGDLSGFLELPGDVLLAVDYAERFREVVALVLHAAIAMENALSQGTERRIRVILISRRSTDVWSELRNEYPLIDRLRSRLVGGWEEVALEPLAPAVADRNTAFVSAYRAFDGYFVKHWAAASPDAVLAPRPVPDPLPDLSDDPFKDVLLIHLAALAVWHDGAGIGSVSRDGLLDWLLTREKRAWNRQIDDRGLSQDLKGRPIEQAAALLTLVSVGGEGIGSLGRAIDLLKLCPLLAGVSGPTLNAIVEMFRELYPGPAWVNGMTPDMIGQYLLRMADDEFLDGFYDDFDET